MLLKDIIVRSKKVPTDCTIALPGAQGVRINFLAMGYLLSCTLTGIKCHSSLLFHSILNQEREKLAY